MNPSDLHHLAGAYALDALDADERRAFEAHYPTCEICSREVVEFRETAAVLADEAAVPPPIDLKASILAEVAQTRQLPPVLPPQVDPGPTGRRRRRDIGTAIMAAAAAVLVVVAGALFALRGEPTDEVGDLLAAPDAEVTTLEGATGGLRIVWSPGLARVAVVGDGLEIAPSGLTYALWFLGPDGAAPAGLFEPDDDGTVRSVIAVGPGDPTAWGVTLEPDGGSPQPTGDVLYSGEL